MEKGGGILKARLYCFRLWGVRGGFRGMGCLGYEPNCDLIFRFEDILTHVVICSFWGNPPHRFCGRRVPIEARSTFPDAHVGLGGRPGRRRFGIHNLSDWVYSDLAP